MDDKKAGDWLKRYIVAICDEETEFVLAIINFLNRSKVIPILSMAFSDVNEMMNYVRNQNIDLILMGEKEREQWEELEESEELKDEGKLKNIPVLIMCKESDCKAEHEELLKPPEMIDPSNGKHFIFKYSSATTYLNRIVDILCTRKSKSIKDGKLFVSYGDQKVVCQAVYSPLGLWEKPNLAQELCSYYGERFGKSNVLYMGFEQCGRETTNQQMEEILYLVKQRANNLSMKIRTLTLEEQQSYSVIPSPCFYEELREWSLEDLDYLISQIKQEALFEQVVFDVGAASFSGISYLASFDFIYLPYLEEYSSNQQWLCFLDFLKRRTGEIGDIVEKVYLADCTSKQQGRQCEIFFNPGELEGRRKKGELRCLSEII